mmetsp:Transcript_11587/g.20868  ORF Transcript_11587/g.20868 Transcript_11587/m.20868 type:complete len:451 (+) Transcript_11587:194-1546(+)|eukprot:CAMPEP_0201607496 /NCGR_PEP_ID=MMETSP0492-20130828/6579_1 /ASSEMBLY_ACC=CAM_ASM_000837 /TAXON_ID=420259 /ORGANISM="Thalassiosira gravida, Strain GMp14c1" /LENGTH=450 /DNA_ID=CAMNT_0048072089 /DNA_START=13 /DNA_END=1365 /DNA_ORIENTATION=+
MTLTNPLGIDIFELVLFLVEFSHYIIGGAAVLLVFAFPPESIVSVNGKTKSVKKDYSKKIALALFVPGLIVTLVASVIFASWEDAYVRGYEIFKYPSLRSKLENYIETGEDDLNDILESDKYAPTFGLVEARYLMKDLLRHTVFHSNDHNEDNIDEGYNKGNDWFKATLGESMMYTTGLYPNGNETLEEAQDYKIDYVADAIELEPGMSVLDIGCGWTYVANRLTEKHGANVTGITLSKEQLAWGKELNKENSATILLQDAMQLKQRTDLPEEGYDRVTSLEMAEHVGIRRYQEFLKMVHSMLKDDGVFYFQVAGLRRAWRYEDLIWGLFMGEHVFPGADASCPLGWISTQVERAGFEIQRVHNMGSHYSKTLDHWLDNWHASKDYIEGKYGAVAYRRWEVFLAWSVRAARQGSSTLFMLTLTKAGEEGRRIDSQNHLVPKDVPSMGNFW